jgi:hypothetical protein
VGLLFFWFNLKYVYPLLEDVHILCRDAKKEGLWSLFYQFILSVFQLTILILANSFTNSSIGLSTTVATEMMNNMLQVGLLLVVTKGTIEVDSWITIRDAVVVSISCLIIAAYVYLEEYWWVGIFFCVCMAIYWVLELLNKVIKLRVRRL